MDRPLSMEPRADLRLMDEAPTGELIKQALEDARELVRIEVGLAKEEAREQLKSVKHAAICGGIALAATLLCLSTATMALVLALRNGGGAPIALAVAGIYLVVALVAGALAYRFVPKEPAGETRRRLEGEIKRLKEHIA